MRIPLLSIILAVAAAALAQQPAKAPAPTASSLLSPAIGQVNGALSDVRLEKWKAPDSVREEANSDIGSITRDLQGTLPPLLAAADQAPGSVTAVLPVFRNVDALYDVLLRVTEAADRGAPREQKAELDDALRALEHARHDLGDAMAQAAASQDAQVSSLRTQLSQAAARPVPVCPPPAHAAHRTVHHHHAAAHATTAKTPQQ